MPEKLIVGLKNSQFHWTVETSEPMIQYLSEQSEEVLTELLERIKKGQIAFGGVHNSVSTEHLGYEAMARLVLYSKPVC